MLDKLLEGLGKNKSTIVAFVVGALIANRITGSVLDKVLAHNGESTAQAEPWKAYVDTRISDLNALSAQRHAEELNSSEDVRKSIQALSGDMKEQFKAMREGMTVLSNRVYDLARSHRISYWAGNLGER